jgi:hypothetical protein
MADDPVSILAGLNLAARLKRVPSLGWLCGYDRGSLHELHADLEKRGIALRIVGARSYVRDFLRADGIGDKVGGLDRAATIHDLVGEAS